MPITISIIMPAYGVKDYIGKAIESVLAQTVADWELIIVNDGSIDGTRDVAQYYAEKDARIYLIDKANGGLSEARNYGLRVAQGKFIHFFDSDDWIDRDFYERFLEQISEEDFIISTYTINKESSKNQYLSDIKHCASLAFPLSNIDEHIEIILPFLNFAWNKLYRKDFLLQNRLQFCNGLSRVEDCEFFARVLACHPRFKIFDYAGYHYVVRPRITLSNYWDEQMLIHSRIRMQASATIYHHLGCSVKKQRVLLRSCAETTARAYLHQLFTSKRKNNFTFLWRKTRDICKLNEIKQAIAFAPIYSNLLTLLIKKALITPIVVLYIFKKRINSQ